MSQFRTIAFQRAECANFCSIFISLKKQTNNEPEFSQMRAMAPPHLVGDIAYCHVHAFCTNTIGGYNCTCSEGYEGDGFNCTDIDECIEGTTTINRYLVCLKIANDQLYISNPPQVHILVNRDF